jgi:acyl carrier protein
MDRQAFLVKLAEILEVDPNQVGEEYKITPSEWDSMRIMSTIALIDDTFGVTIPARDFSACTTVRSLMELAERLPAAADPSQG